jgi:hypothetical protein
MVGRRRGLSAVTVRYSDASCRRVTRAAKVRRDRLLTINSVFTVRQTR